MALCTSIGKQKQGFTLVELLVVMAIVALLLTVALPRYFGSIQHSKEVVLKENLQVMRSALDLFFSDKGRYPVTLEELVQYGYLRSIPQDPITESNLTWQMRSAGSSADGLPDIFSGAVGVSRSGLPYASY